jgi:hypothetical protein
MENIPFANVDPVNKDGTLLHLVEPFKKMEQGSLSCPGGSYDGNRFPFSDRKRNFMEHPICPVIRKGDVTKFNVPPDLIFPGEKGLGNLIVPIEQRKYPFQRSHGRLKDIIFLRKVSDGLKEHSNVGEKSDKTAQGDSLLDHLPTSVPEEETDGPRTQYFHKGNEERIDGDLLHVGQIMTFVDLMKPPAILLFPLKDLNHFDARKAFLKEGIHLGNSSTDFSKSISRLTAEEKRSDENERKDRKGNQS